MQNQASLAKFAAEAWLLALIFALNKGNPAEYLHIFGPCFAQEVQYTSNKWLNSFYCSAILLPSNVGISLMVVGFALQGLQTCGLPAVSNTGLV